MDAPLPTLIGALTIDHFVGSNVDRPGGGALNMAYHWTNLGRPHRLIGRVGSDDGDTLSDFCTRHGIPLTPDATVEGESSSVEVHVGAEGEVTMVNFVEGANRALRLTDREASWLMSGAPVHLVLTDVVDAELHRLAGERSFVGARLSGDFLSLRHMDIDRFAASIGHLDMAFVGWPGGLDDPLLDQLASVADRTNSVLVVTCGSAEVIVADGRSGERRRFDVAHREVAGTTIGCGDAFAAAFLHSWYELGNIDAAVNAGKDLGGEATRWFAALPDGAYDPVT